MVAPKLLWITGPSRSGKTTRLIRQFCHWLSLDSARVGDSNSPPAIALSPSGPALGVLVLSATGDTRIEIADRLITATQSKYPFYATTPLGLFQDEVSLFWPLLVQQLDLKAQFPLRLNPENEQELATQLWQAELDPVIAQFGSLNQARLVRRLLDLLQLAGLAGIPMEDIPTMLQDGLTGQEQELPIAFPTIGSMLQQWQQWCLQRGLLSYGLMAELYWRYLLPHPTYQQHLSQRYQIVLADDVDEYPAIARLLLQALIQSGATAAFTFNPDGCVRLGLGADPNYLVELADYCQLEVLPSRPVLSLELEWGNAIVDFVTNPLAFLSLPDTIQTIQAVSRAQLLRQTANTIIDAVQTQTIQPKDIAVIGPGLDAIARYTLIEILSKHQVPVESLNDQRPLNSFPVVRALLTLLSLIYVGLGRLIDRNAVAEMLVVLSSQAVSSNPQDPIRSSPPFTAMAKSAIDPVRAGLLADSCFVPHADHPRLLPANTFSRWDRLGYQASESYENLIRWIAYQQEQLEQRLIPNPVSLLDRAIQQFLLTGNSLPFNQLAAIRQLIETAQHYWEISSRLRQGQRGDEPAALTVSRFIQLLKTGAIAANPYPVRPMGTASNAVTLATVFQYRSSRRAHRWQFWLDAASSRWLSGVDSIFAAPLFLHEWSGRPWTSSDRMLANEQRLRRILLDLLSRTEDRIYLCHSELATNGQEQTGALLPLVNTAMPLTI